MRDNDEFKAYAQKMKMKAKFTEEMYNDMKK